MHSGRISLQISVRETPRLRHFAAWSAANVATVARHVELFASGQLGVLRSRQRRHVRRRLRDANCLLRSPPRRWSDRNDELPPTGVHYRHGE
jgi:hypothetical protein